MNATRASQLNGKRRHGLRAGRGRKSPRWQFLRGFLKHPVMVGSVIPSSRILIDKMLKPVDWSATKLFVEYGPGVGTFTRPILERLGPDAKLIAIDTNPDFIDYLNGDIDDDRFIAVHGSAADVEKIIAEHGFDHADYHPVRPALLDPAAGRRRGDRRGDRPGHPRRRRLPGLSVQPQGARLHRPAFRADRPRLRMGQRAAGDPVLGLARPGARPVRGSAAA